MTTPSKTHRLILERTRVLLDDLAHREIGADQLQQMAGLLEQVARLSSTGQIGAELPDPAAHAVGDPRQFPSAGAWRPEITVVDAVPGELRARTRFRQFHDGVGGAAHGGVIAVVFDDALGLLANLERPQAGVTRTAYLNVSYRSVTPIGPWLDVHCAVAHAEGRKRFVQGTLEQDGRLLAEAEGLWIDTQPPS